MSYTYALPVSFAPVSSRLAPTTTRVPEIATVSPKLSPSDGVGLCSVATGIGGAALPMSYTYALPASVAAISSPLAPTTTRLPEMVTAPPKLSHDSGVGLCSVATATVGAVLPRSNT